MELLQTPTKTVIRGKPDIFLFSCPLQMTKVLTTEEPQNPAGDEMQVHQDTFLRNVLDQQKLADIDVHVSGIVSLLGVRGRVGNIVFRHRKTGRGRVQPACCTRTSYSSYLTWNLTYINSARG
jgi:hypothetical protein